ncbi:HAD family hydrolase [Pseudomonas syringae pv. actinidiae]|nr:HAD family hydrolase [Pseudomonas syringae pv. actinidiae]
MTAFKAVVFDAYGTLVHITQPTNPYEQLFKLSSSGRSNAENFRRAVMTNEGFIEEAAYLLGINASLDQICHIKHMLNAEVGSVRVYEDVIPTLRDLQGAGIKIGLCSNLAEAYAIPIREDIPVAFDAMALSFEVNAMKPDAAIYDALITQLGCKAEEILFVGDSYHNDYIGPTAQGMAALLLRRSTDPNPEWHRINSLSEVIARATGEIKIRT